jgi:hypothetical protein
MMMVMMTRAEELENLLHRMRQQTWGTKKERQQRQTECWVLAGVVEELKAGRAPVSISAAKYLR